MKGALGWLTTVALVVVGAFSVFGLSSTGEMPSSGANATRLLHGVGVTGCAIGITVIWFRRRRRSRAAPAQLRESPSARQSLM